MTSKARKTVPTKAAAPAAKAAPAEDGRKGRSRIRDRVLKYIEDARGANVYVGDMARDLNALEGSIQNAINDLRKSIPQLQVVIPGRSWRWVANAEAPKTEAAAKEKRMFEEIGTTKSGDLLIKDTEGTIYTATEL